MRFDRIIQPWVEKSCVDIVTYCQEGVCLSHFLVAKIRSPDFPVPVGNMNIMNMFIVTTHTTYCTSKWMGYSGNSIYKWMISATPILRNTHINTHTHIYIQKGTLSGPHFSTFLKMQCFCYIMFNPLCSYTCDGIARDPHRFSDFLRGCQRMSRESWRSPGKRKEERQT